MRNLLTLEPMEKKYSKGKEKLLKDIE